jgi:hypothetical protein
MHTDRKMSVWWQPRKQYLTNKQTKKLCQNGWFYRTDVGGAVIHIATAIIHQSVHHDYRDNGNTGNGVEGLGLGRVSRSYQVSRPRRGRRHAPGKGFAGPDIPRFDSRWRVGCWKDAAGVLNQFSDRVLRRVTPGKGFAGPDIPGSVTASTMSSVSAFGSREGRRAADIHGDADTESILRSYSDE